MCIRDSGKTATAAALATWLGRCGRYRHMAYACGDDAGEPRALLETLGRQLLPQGEHWSVDRFPTLWQALDHLRQTLRPVSYTHLDVYKRQGSRRRRARPRSR